jgi:NAD(P)-dependent dehydrogenase (short-subunit alcohol dehydrogenase family)
LKFWWENDISYFSIQERANKMKLSSKVAIVTGAGRGIGKDISLAFAQNGADVVVISRTESEIDETAKQIQLLGRKGLPIRVDVSNTENVKNAVDLTIKAFGQIDILVNAAGIQGPIGSVLENDINAWIQTIEVNLIGTFLFTKAVLPIMIERKKGKIINFSGGGATSPRPCFTAYAASKGAVVHFTESLAEEIKQFNIQVNAVAPGAVNTRMLDLVLAAGDMAGEKESIRAKEQLKSGGTPPEKPASLAVFLASDESANLTGKLISAVWDDWQNFPGKINDIMTSDIYTLRRVVK